jgi:hypothetical protein
MKDFGSYSCFFSSPVINDDVKKKIIFKDIIKKDGVPFKKNMKVKTIKKNIKKITKLNATAAEYIPCSTSQNFSSDDVFANAGNGIYMPVIGNCDVSPSTNTSDEENTSPFMSCTTGKRVKPSLVYCRYGNNCLQINCPYSHTVSDDISIQLYSPSSVLPTSILPVQHLDNFPEHTQRLIALGVFNERPIAPKYTIAVIPNSSKKKRQRRKSPQIIKQKLTSASESVFNSSPCSREDALLIRGLIKNLSCLNTGDSTSLSVNRDNEIDAPVSSTIN